MTDGDQRKTRPEGWFARLTALFLSEPALSDTFSAVLAASFVLVVGGLELILPPELSLKPLYVGGVIAATLFGGAGFGLTIALVGWGFSVFDKLHPSERLQIPPDWITALNLGSDMAYLLVAFALALWGGAAFMRERWLSRTDALTGIANRLGLHGLLDYELRRHHRAHSPLTLAYLDCDNFKFVNDTYGHEEGDQLLRLVARTMKIALRRTDCVARMGGDEFALVLIDTSKAEAQIAVEKLVALLLDEMARNRWNVTFSIGAVTLTQPQVSVEEALRLADCTMYGVKHGGKAAAAFIEDTELAVIPVQARHQRQRVSG